MPLADFNAMMALNAIHPFTYDAQAEREGLLVTETLNQRRKKQLKSDQLFPYLSREIPDWLQDNRIVVAKELIKRHEHGSKIRKQEPNFNYVRNLIEEEIEIESCKQKPDEIVVRELIKLLEVCNRGKVNSDS